jgi:hypothetical protein|tara:strand:+ start:312 stop:620 length:309 start_codon:yes stop_codon:yes gene_type:complete
MADFSRVFIEQVNNEKVNVIYDFAYGEYIATKDFFDLLSVVQADLLDDGMVTLQTGQEVSSDSPGGLLAIQFYMETLDSTRQSMSGLAKLGLNVEKNLWKNI